VRQASVDETYDEGGPQEVRSPAVSSGPPKIGVRLPFAPALAKVATPVPQPKAAEEEEDEYYQVV